MLLPARPSIGAVCLLLACVAPAQFASAAAKQDASGSAAAGQAAEHPEFREEARIPPATGTITFKFEDARLQPAAYELTLHGDGSGHFVSHTGSAPPDDIANLPAQGQQRDIVLAEATRVRIFAIAAKEKYFAIKCNSGNAKVAFQGTKTLAYEGPEGRGACTFNYAQDSKLQWLTSQLIGLAATLEEGRRLTVEHEHGRLALDAELETLESMVHDGQATEITNIAPILRTIAADESVMTRARRRAQTLLDNDAAAASK